MRTVKGSVAWRPPVPKVSKRRSAAGRPAAAQARVERVREQVDELGVAEADDVPVLEVHLGRRHRAAVDLLRDPKRPGVEFADDGVERPQSPLAGGARKRRDRFPSFEAALENFTAKPPMNSFHPVAREAYVRHGFAPTPDGDITLKCLPEHEARTYETGATSGMFARLLFGCGVVLSGM